VTTLGIQIDGSYVIISSEDGRHSKRGQSVSAGNQRKAKFVRVFIGSSFLFFVSVRIARKSNLTSNPRRSTMMSRLGENKMIVMQEQLRLFI
jgi:hypothetical protein